MSLKINTEKLIEDYNKGISMHTLARMYGTYPTTIKRILEREGIELRHDVKRNGTLYVKNGEKLIKWAKAQGRLVTREELAKIVGTKRLSPSYFIKYPELGQYVVAYGQNDVQKYTEQLLKWLQDNNIPYKPNDRTKLKVSVTALLLEDYSNIAIQIDIKSKSMSKRRYEKMKQTRIDKAKKEKMSLILLNEKHFENLDCIKEILLHFK